MLVLLVTVEIEASQRVHVRFRAFSGLRSSTGQTPVTVWPLASVASFVIPMDRHNPLLGRELDIVLGLASIVVFRRRQDRPNSRSRPFRGRLAPTIRKVVALARTSVSLAT
jgi:hypothetical protein